MGYKRFVEVGRVALINYGEQYGKLCVIMDVLDHNRCLIDGPTTGVARQVINFRRIALTDIVVKVARTNKTSTLKSKLEGLETSIQDQFDACAWGQKLQRKNKRADLNDFGRFKVAIAKQKRNKAIAAKVAAKLG